MDIDVSASIDVNKNHELCMNSPESTNAINPSSSCSTPLPAPSKSISAMKGSRERQRAGPPQKLTVKWAPEVYDPVPTSVSHAVTNNKPQKQSKKKSKSKQKAGNKSSRGNKHKENLAGKRGSV